MKKKFANTFWARSAIVAIGLIAAVVVMVGLGHSTSEPVYATHGAGAETVSGVTISPNTTGKNAEVVFTFDVIADVPAYTGEFIITFDKDSGVPTSLSRNAVMISASHLTNASSGTATAAGGQAVALAFDPTFGEDSSDSRRVKVTMKIPDMNASTSAPGVGVQGIELGAKVTVTLTTSAGFYNAEEADNQGFHIVMAASAGGANVITGATPAPGGKVSAEAVIKIFTNAPSRRRGNSLTVTGRGYKGGLTATVWLDNGVDLDGDGDIDQTAQVTANETVSGVDLNGDGDALDTAVTTFSEVFIGGDINGDGDALDTAVAFIRDTSLRNNGKRDVGERDLGGAIVGGDGNFTASFTVANPPFSSVTLSEVGAVDLNADGDSTDTSVALNVINAIDGTAAVASYDNTRTVALSPSLSIAPSEVSIGDTVTLTLRDFTAGSIINSVVVANKTVSLVGVTGLTINSAGEATINVDIPGQGVPIGMQVLVVATNGGQDHDADISILGATVSTSHSDIIPNQDLTITGSGFSESTGSTTVCVDIDKFTLSNVPLVIDSDSRDTSCSSTGVKITSGGTFVATVIIRSTGTTAFPSSLLTSGSHELKIIDSGGTEGKINLTLKDRAFTIDPPISGPRDTVTIIGSGYPADNSDTGSSSVTICYQPVGSTCGRQVTVTPDFSGNFREPLRIPNDVGIPSTNTVTSTIGSGAGATVDTITHEVPKSSASVTPVRGASGTTVSISGGGFRDFASVETVKIGGLNALGSQSINTDRNGQFTVDNLIVPGLDPGIHSLEVTVGTGTLETTANTSFEVLAEGVTGVPTGVVSAVEPLGDALVRVFNFNNATKSWTFYDPRPEFSDANDLEELIDGAIYWFNVTVDQLGVILNGRTRNFTCLNAGTPQEDCWNQDTW